MAERRRFPGYSTLAKWDSPSWNDATRASVGHRLNNPPERHFFGSHEFAILEALCDRIVPQSDVARKVPIAAFVDHKMAANQTDGMQPDGEPAMQELWRRGLRALDAEAKLRFGAGFTELIGGRQDDVITMLQTKDVRAPEWDGVPLDSFFKSRVLHDIVTYFYGMPQGWDQMGFGGPASPRGYVRLGADGHDPWDAVEAR
jgi:Gluconate 2-dehydrogenase subunit 3